MSNIHSSDVHTELLHFCRTVLRLIKYYWNSFHSLKFSSVWNPQKRESLIFPFSGLIWKTIFRTWISSDSVRDGWDCKMQNSDMEYIHCQCRFVSILFSLFCSERISPGSGVLGWCHGWAAVPQSAGNNSTSCAWNNLPGMRLSAWTGQHFCTHANVSANTPGSGDWSFCVLELKSRNALKRELYFACLRTSESQSGLGWNGL